MAGPPPPPQPLLVEVREPARYKEGAGVFVGPLGDHALGGEATPSVGRPPLQTTQPGAGCPDWHLGPMWHLSHSSASSLFLMQKDLLPQSAFVILFNWSCPWTLHHPELSCL